MTTLGTLSRDRSVVGSGLRLIACLSAIHTYFRSRRGVVAFFIVFGVTAVILVLLFLASGR
jgi:hypothetical protein